MMYVGLWFDLHEQELGSMVLVQPHSGLSANETVLNTDSLNVFNNL